MRRTRPLIAPRVVFDVVVVALGTTAAGLSSELAGNPMLHVPAAAFFWTTNDELRAAIDSCLRQDEAYEKRKAAWPAAVSEHLYRADDLTNERLYDFLFEHGAVTPVDEEARLSEKATAQR